MKRQIGTLGTLARTIVGVWMLGSVIYGHFIRGPFRPLPWIVGLVVLPAVFIAWRWLAIRRNPTRLEATGPLASAVNVALFFYFWLWSPSPVWFMSDAVLIFYGSSMLLAAARGYAGCEALALPNWLLKRDDQIGCLCFSPIDHAEGKLRGALAKNE